MYSASSSPRVPDEHTGSLVKFEFQIKKKPQKLLKYKYVPCNSWDILNTNFFLLCFLCVTRNTHLIGGPVFLFAKIWQPDSLRTPPALEARCPPQAGEPARGSHAGRSLATQPQREPGRRNLSTCLINGGAETAAQTGLRQPHKEEAPRPLPPSIDPGPLWLGQRGHGEAPRGDSAHSH